MDTIGNLPAHPLIVHGAVVLTPLAAVGLLIYCLIPAWRTGLRWPLLAVALGGALTGWMSEESGEALQSRLRSLGNKGELISNHVDAGELAAKAGIMVAALAIVVMFFLLSPNKDASSFKRILAIALTVIIGGYATYLLIEAGHSGATAAWDGIVENSQAPSD